MIKFLKKILLALLFPVFLHAQVPSDGAYTYEWFSANFEHVQTVLKSKNDPDLEAYIYAIGNFYKTADGGMFLEVSPFIGIALTYHPEITLKWFQKNPDVFEDWLKKVDVSLFTDFQGTKAAELARDKTRLMQSLRKFEANATDQQLRKTSKRIRKVVESLKIRIVD
jgi:hypothetical protein